MSAEDFYLTGNYAGTWNDYKMDCVTDGASYTYEFKSTQSGEFYYRFRSSDFDAQLCPYTDKFDLKSVADYNVTYTDNKEISGVSEFCFQTKLESGKTYVFTVIIDSSKKRTVSCKEKGTSTTDYAKLWVIGGLPNAWTEDETRPFETTDGKVYQYTFTSDFTYAFTTSPNAYYMRVKYTNSSESGELQPHTNDTEITTDYAQMEGRGSNQGTAWKLSMEKGKAYTIVVNYETKQIKYFAGVPASAKAFELWDSDNDTKIAESSTSGTYTLDLTADGATYKSIYLKVDDGATKWGLETTQDATTGSTSVTYYFVENGGAALTFKAGYKYTLKLTDDGTLTVTAIAAAQVRQLSAGFYLVGNFFNTDKVDINYDNAIFKFKQIDDTHYQMDIPASLTAYAQVLQVNGQNKAVAVYGPKAADRNIHNTRPATDGSVSGDLEKSETIEKGELYWHMSTRNVSASDYTDGMYEVVITTDGKGTATEWKITHDTSRRVAYYLSTAEYATASPIYDRLRQNRSGNDNRYYDKFYATIHMEENASYYVAGNILYSQELTSLANSYGAIKASDNISPTANKLFLQGNGNQALENDGMRVYPDAEPFVAGTHAGTHVAEYKPCQGSYDLANQANHVGICGLVEIISGKLDVTSVSMVGDAINGTVTNKVWNWGSPVADMPYDDTEHCYKLTISTTSDNLNKLFRFVGNHLQSMNWYEDDTKAVYPYENKKEGETAATTADPNIVLLASSADNSEDINYHINWNRPQGTWTVRFYITAIGDAETGNSAVLTYKYTITDNDVLELRDLQELNYYDVKRNVCNRGSYRYFRSWSDDKAWKAPEGVDVFVVDKYTPATEANNYTATISLKQIDNDDTYGLKGIIPANTGVILAATSAVEGTFVKTTSKAGYNVMRITMEEADDNTAAYTGNDNLLKYSIYAKNIPSYESGYYNYLFGYYNANRVLPETYKDTKDFLLGFWISNGVGNFHSNAAYLHFTEKEVENLGLGTSYAGFGTTQNAKKIPALLFDFDNNDNGTTGIKNIDKTTVGSNDKYYTLSGVMVEKPTAKGIYIHNGKKFIVK